MGYITSGPWCGKESNRLHSPCRLGVLQGGTNNVQIVFKQVTNTCMGNLSGLGLPLETPFYPVLVPKCPILKGFRILQPTIPSGLGSVGSRGF